MYYYNGSVLVPFLVSDVRVGLNLGRFAYNEQEAGCSLYSLVVHAGMILRIGDTAK